MGDPTRIRKFTNISNIRSNLTFKPQNPKNPHVNQLSFSIAQKFFILKNVKKSIHFTD